MYKIIIAFLLLLAFGASIKAQNRSIQFEHSSWAQVMKKARQEKKMIFIDAYTSWCGPCKLMAKEVFTRDEVADYYNKHFICIKYDVEKDKTIPMKNPYGISCYPTFLYLTPDGEVVHKVVGSCEPDEFIAWAKKAADPEQNLSGLEKRYRAGENNPALLKQYARVLLDAYSTECDKIAGEYMTGFSEEEFYSKENWELISDLNDPTAYPLLKTRQNRHRFYQIIDTAVVDRKLTATFMEHIFPYLENESHFILDERGQELIRFMQATGESPYYLNLLLARDYKSRGDYRMLLDQMKVVCGCNILKKQTSSFCALVLKYFSDCRDKVVIREAVDWLDVMSRNEYYPSSFKSLLQQNRNTLYGML